jgi:hypothetical protein
MNNGYLQLHIALKQLRAAVEPLSNLGFSLLCEHTVGLPFRFAVNDLVDGGLQSCYGDQLSFRQL